MERNSELQIPTLKEGDKIYHYTSAAGLQGILGKEFWITECHFLNDSSEFQVGTEVFIELLRNNISDSNMLDKMIADLQAELQELERMPKVGEKCAFAGEYVISFCKDEDSALMWSEYSDFKGYCMEFDFKELLNSFGEVYFHGAVVYNYQEQLQYVENTFTNQFFRDGIIDGIHNWEEINSIKDADYKVFIGHCAIICKLYNMFFKKACFEGEHEYRFIFSSIHDGGLIKDEMREKLYFRIKNEVYIPYIKKKVCSLSGLKSVLVGPKNKSDIAVKGLEYFLRNEKLDVVVKKSEMPLRY